MTKQIKRCLVTGSSGFVGRVLCAQLRALGVTVDGLGRNPATHCGEGSSAGGGETIDGGNFWQLDLASEKVPLAALADVDCVFHLAAVAHTSRSAPLAESVYFAVNLDATLDLLEKSLQAGVKRFIYVSSIKADLTSESFPSADAYSRSKFLAEQALLEVAARAEMHIVIIRPSLIYGAGVKGNLLSMMQSIRKGRFPLLPYHTGPRSMVSVEDVVSALVLAASHSCAKGQCYVLADDLPLTARALQNAMREAAGMSITRRQLPISLFHALAAVGDILEKATGRPMPINSEVTDKLFSPALYHADKAREELGWFPTLTFYDRIGQMMMHADAQIKG